MISMFKDESGAALVEYALIIALVAVACIVSMQTLADKIRGSFNHTTQALGG